MPPKLPKTNEPQAPLLTVKQVAALDGTCERTVRRAIASGRLEVIYLGRMIRISPEAHDAYRRAGR